MATNLSVKRAPDDAETGIRIETIYARETDGSVASGVARGLGGPTATNGAGTTDKLLTRMMTTAVDDAWQTSVLAVATTAVEGAATPLSNRKGALLYNEGPDLCFIGPANTVTATGATRGVSFPPGAHLFLGLGPRLDLWFICATGKTASITIAEFA